jgi:nicotinamidase-related amidase
MADAPATDHRHRLATEPLSPTAMHLCVDMQSLFDRGAPWETPWLPRVLPRVLQLARARPDHTIFTRFMPPYRPEEMPGRWRRYYEHWRQVTRERIDPALLELLPPLAALCPPAVVVDKPAYSAFAAPTLDQLLARRGADALVISGTETDVCVLGTVLDAVDRGLRVIVVRDAVCGSRDDTHDTTVDLYQRRFKHQVEVADTAELLAHWRS